MPEPQPNPPFPLAKAGLCVKCGLCLPHCPTYQETRHEAESPRGRIMLMQALAGGDVAQSASLEAHLDACLGCRNCERVCPAQVPYGELIDAGRAMIATTRAPSRLIRWLGLWLSSAPLRRLTRRLLVIFRYSGLQTVITASGLIRCGRLGRWTSLIPRMSRAPGVGSWQAPAQGKAVQIFAGCVGEIADQATLQTLRTLLQRCGYEVRTPLAQTCCGALHQHAGMPASAALLATRNLSAFAGDLPILYAASGCGATLQEYGRLLGADAAEFGRRVQDPHRFLLDRWPAEARLQPLAATIAVHLPCTQRNVTGGGAAMMALLGKIPGARIEALDPEHACCGAAGTYFLTQPAMADRLLDHKLDALAAAKPDFLVSSNIGCSLHIEAGLRRSGFSVPVLHPLALLARQWPSGR